METFCQLASLHNISTVATFSTITLRPEGNSILLKIHVIFITYKNGKLWILSRWLILLTVPWNRLWQTSGGQRIVVLTQLRKSRGTPACAGYRQIHRGSLNFIDMRESWHFNKFSIRRVDVTAPKATDTIKS